MPKLTSPEGEQFDIETEAGARALENLGWERDESDKAPAKKAASKSDKK